MKILKDNINDFFKWVKGTELVELDDIDVSEDPVRPELTLGFRISHDRKIFGLKYNNEIVKIGGPVSSQGIILTGRDSLGKIEGKIVKKENKIFN